MSALFEVSQGEVGYHRSIAKFYALETVARVPYFSYTSVLHLYETVGHFRNKELLRMHFEESWNELHHLLIMEELGGDSIFTDRVIATHMAFFYYWIVVNNKNVWVSPLDKQARAIKPSPGVAIPAYSHNVFVH